MFHVDQPGTMMVVFPPHLLYTLSKAMNCMDCPLLPRPYSTAKPDIPAFHSNLSEIEKLSTACFYSYPLYYYCIFSWNQTSSPYYRLFFSNFVSITFYFSIKIYNPIWKVDTNFIFENPKFSLISLHFTQGHVLLVDDASSACYSAFIRYFWFVYAQQIHPRHFSLAHHSGRYRSIWLPGLGDFI